VGLGVLLLVYRLETNESSLPSLHQSKPYDEYPEYNAYSGRVNVHIPSGNSLFGEYSSMHDNEAEDEESTGVNQLQYVQEKVNIRISTGNRL
jgi:hypothetical protein